MSNTRVHGYVVFECDGCGDDWDTMEKDFYNAQQEIKEQGWKTHKDDDGKWVNLCEKCSEDLTK